MATKTHILNGFDCFGDNMALEVRRDKKKVVVTTVDDQKFCCKYDDLVELVNALAPKKKDKKDKGKVPDGVSLPTDGVT